MRLPGLLSRIAFPSRLFWKIFVSLWLAIAAISLCVDWAVNQLFQAELRQSPDLSIGFRAELATSLVASSLRHGGIEEARQLFADWAGRRDLPVLVTDEAGKDILGRPVPPAAREQARRLLTDQIEDLAVRQVVTPDGTDYLLFVPLQLLPATAPQLHVYHYADSARVQAVAMALVSFLFAVGLAWYLYRPIRILHDANRRFAGGDLTTRVSPAIGCRRDEIADLGRDFDDMAGRLQGVIEEKTRLLHDVSHELRSPLARMQIALELVRQQPAKVDEMFERITYEIDRLDKMLGETLTLSRLQSDQPVTDEECVNLGELLAEIVGDARFEARGSGARVELSVAGEFLVAGRSELLRSAFENVIRNGILHTPKAATVCIGVVAAGAGIVSVKVCDGGKGVAEDELPFLFEPFFRGRGAGKASGYGLGLSIVRHAIELHGGRVSATNDAEGGLCVILQLPVIRLD
jgi:two-component system OmpR family sensor kinase